MKECEFQTTVSQPYNQKLTSDYLLKQICDGKYFGAVVCDIHVPEHLKPDFAEMAPVFKNVEVIEKNIVFASNLVRAVSRQPLGVFISNFRHRSVRVCNCAFLRFIHVTHILGIFG